MPKRAPVAEPSCSEEAPSAGTDWSKLTVAVLKEELVARGLSKSGLKPELVARLEATVNRPDPASDSNPNGGESRSTTFTDWSKHTVPQLKDELGTRGLTKAGCKVDLVARLEASDNSQHLPPDEPAPQRKRAKRAASPDVVVEGPSASQLILNQHSNQGTGERRLRPFVPGPDEEYLKKVKKVRKERMFMLHRQKSSDQHGYECELFDIAGSKGNIYQVEIGRKPKCNCMDARIRDNKCKHRYYALIVILKAPAHLCYQLAFLSDELASIFANAPVTRASEALAGPKVPEEEAFDGNRKPIDGECPICVFTMETDEEIVWCKASCGQNFHKECFQQWKTSKRGGRVTCVYCRADWQEDKPAAGSLEGLVQSAPKIGSYRNIGHLPMYQQEHGHEVGG